MAKHTFLNTTPGMKGVNTIDGLVYVDPGVSAELDVDAAELASAKKAGYFKIDSGDEPDATDLSKNTVAELRVIAAAEGVTVADDAKKADLVAAIEAHRLANPPPPPPPAA
jgi:hypothetical protein